MRNIYAVLSLVSTLSFAGNGTYFIGISPASKAMGGTGVANATRSVDAAFKNPAMFSELPLEKGGIMADANFALIKQNASAENTSLGEKSSIGGVAFAPALSAAYRVCDPMTIGLSAFTYGGAKADFTGQATLQEIKADSSVTYLGPTISYKLFDMWSLGVSPHFVYANLALNSSNAAAGAAQSSRPLTNTLAYGIKFGTSVTPLKDLTIGLSYNPKVRIRYKEVADLDALNLLTGGVGDGRLDDIDTEDPSQVALGVSYAITPAIKVTADGRYIGWSSADVFRELGWRDQYVIALGGEYKLDKLAFRAGFNYARSVIDSVSGENGLTPVTVSGHTVSQASVSNLDLVGFPGISTTHVTVGGGYDITEKFVADLAIAYVPETSVTRSGTAGATAYSYTGKVSQWSVGLGGAYRF